MSEPVKITSEEKTERTKDPRRVEAGKKLGAISRQAKEKKANREEANQALQASDTPYGEFSSIAAFLVASVVVGGIVYHYKTSQSQSKDVSRDRKDDQQDVSRDRQDNLPSSSKDVQQDVPKQNTRARRELDTLD